VLDGTRGAIQQISATPLQQISASTQPLALARSTFDLASSYSILMPLPMALLPHSPSQPPSLATLKPRRAWQKSPLGAPQGVLAVVLMFATITTTISRCVPVFPPIFGGR
jgi:hypothetical protein